MKHFQPPTTLPYVFDDSIFLAGSIEMGKAEKWQDRFVEAFKDDDVILLNPRRDDWDPSWRYDDPEGRGQLAAQITWELNALDEATVIAMYFDPNTMSPVSMLEFGLYAASNRLVVCCPRDFFRYGNLVETAGRYPVDFCTKWEHFIPLVREKLK
jgi:hypothetical protein